MKQRVQGIFIGAFITILLFGAGRVFANAPQNVNVVVNGVNQNFSEDSMPFIYGGRTFLPVRGVAMALGAYVRWVPETSTVYIDDEWPVHMMPDPFAMMPAPTPVPTHPARTSLSRMQRFNNQAVPLVEWGGLLSVPTSTTFFPYRVTRYGTFQISQWAALHSVDFGITNYDTFSGTLVHYENQRETYGFSKVRIYGDEELLFESPVISRDTEPIPFEIDVSGISLMRIAAENSTLYRHTVGIDDAFFERN